MIRCSWPLLLLAAIAPMTLAGCGGSADSVSADAAKTAEDDETASSASTVSGKTRPTARPMEYKPQPSIYINAVAPIERPVVVIHTSAGDIQIELDMEKAPQTVLNFLDNYVRSGFYDQTIFHYADANSFVAAGGFTADLELKATNSPIFNESNNGLSNVRGTVAMSRDANSAHSATSQFFINVVDNPDLDYQGNDTDARRGYCVFGHVVKGMELVDQIAQSQVRQEGDFERLPIRPIVIETVEELR